MKTNTTQEDFWIGNFGKEYMSRNDVNSVIKNNIQLFKTALRKTSKIQTILELGCNIGLNIKALSEIDNQLIIDAYEIYDAAADRAQIVASGTVFKESITSKFTSKKVYDLVFTKGVLIHIAPSHLDTVYLNMFNSSKRYILLSEYYNPTPVSVDYRGEKDKLFKRDFAGDFIEKFNMRLVDYGFFYHRDKNYPQDDENWFLLEKDNNGY